MKCFSSVPQVFEEGPELSWIPPEYNRNAVRSMGRMSGEVSAPTLPAGALSYLAKMNVLPRPEGVRETVPEETRRQGGDQLYYCAVELEEDEYVPVVAANDEDGHVAVQYRRGLTRAIAMDFSKAIVAEPSEFCVRKGGLRFVFDLGPGKLLLLEGFAITLHLGAQVPWANDDGDGLGSDHQQHQVVEDDVEVQIELTPEVLEPGVLASGLDRHQPVTPLRAQGILRAPTRPRRQRPHVIMLSSPHPRCGPLKVLTAHVPKANAAEDLTLSRMFALTTKSQLLTGQALVFRQLELYGVLMDVPEEIRAPDARGLFSFDSRSRTCVRASPPPPSPPAD
eukprot:TRINITY_DN18079_c0_g1_i2.p1 TRINITY_DN18079_c0_g1~~TRINITY_DN18079_c0_g1_i2.p1  ORF type:complete len:337 (-),score=76.18 TRINITY_DN18079_c0_g1_i2:21-1031(-)